MRSFFYLARSYQNYLHKTGQSLYSSAKVVLPQSELYVIYTGNRDIGEKKEISLSEEFFGGRPSAVEIRVQVISESEGDDIINQYILFSKVMDEQIRICGRNARAVGKAIRICKDRNILRKFLEEHEREAVDIMVQLYSQKEVMEDLLVYEHEEGRKEGREEGEAKGRMEGEVKGRMEGEEKGRQEGETKKARETSAKLYAKGWSIADIADLVNYSIDTVGGWLELSEA